MERIAKEQIVRNLAVSSANGKFEAIAYYGEHKMLVGGKSHDNVLFGRVTKYVEVSGVQFGVNYENKVNNELERNGFARDFSAGEMRGCKWEVFPCLVRAIKSDKLQMRVTCTKSTEFHTAYFVDGRKATDDEVTMIKKYTPDNGKPEVFNITIEKIVSWKMGSVAFTDYDLKAEVECYAAAV